MYKALNGNAIGIKNQPLPQLITLAKTTGFAGVDFDIREALAIARQSSVPALRDLFAASAIRPAQWGLPVNGVQTEWSVDLTELAGCASLAAQLGATRCATWVPSWSDNRGPAKNAAFHIDRLRPVARVLGDHGCSLGLEFLGPKTLLKGHSYAFIRTMGAMMDLARQIGPNVGLLVDAWHLFTSGGTLAQLQQLSPENIVHVHISDAPKDVPFDEVIDTQRHLPLETGVLDLPGFLRTLVVVGYQGPVVTEPFNARINEIAARDPEAAAKEVSEAMDKLWQAAGLA